MSAECESCGEHILDCYCDNYISPEPKIIKKGKITMKEHERHLMEFEFAFECLCENIKTLSEQDKLNVTFEMGRAFQRCRDAYKALMG